jgi:flagellar biosynthesis/type III secretory pathway protein FliH
MAEFPQHTDIDWDATLNIEANSFETGYLDAQKDANFEEQRNNGKLSGISNGYNIGFEIGFLEESCNSYIKDHESDDLNKAALTCKQIREKCLCITNKVYSSIQID